MAAARVGGMVCPFRHRSIFSTSSGAKRISKRSLSMGDHVRNYPLTSNGDVSEPGSAIADWRANWMAVMAAISPLLFAASVSIAAVMARHPAQARLL